VISRAFFLGIFGAGLGLAVFAMLHGVERSRAITSPRPSSVFNAPTISVFAIVLGAIGYFLITRSFLTLATVLIIGCAAGLAGSIGMIILLTHWAFPYAGTPTDDDTLQGQIALVTRRISPSAAGEIAFQSNGAHHTLVAESLQGSEIECDTEVVIDTIRDGIATVELWSVVEDRI
jgi:hypothetical protein